MEAKKTKPVRNALGRGLSSLISTPVPAVASSAPLTIVPSVEAPSPGQLNVVSEQKIKSNQIAGVQYISVDSINNNPLQPRRDFKDEELKELAESIRTQGVLQPMLVRPSKAHNNQYEIVAGERRWRAAKIAGLSQVPVVIRDLDEQQTLEISIIENIQRQDLSPIEEARAYERLATEFKLGHQEIAERVGKNRTSITNYLRLLKLPSEVLEMLRASQLTMGHAKAILTIREPNAQLSLARKSVKENLSVRQLEAIVSRVVVLDAGHRLPSKDGTRDLSDLQSSSEPFPEAVDRIRNALGTKVSIKHHRTGKGRIEIEYFSEQDLDRLVERICE